MIDRGLSVAEIDGMIEVAGEYIDIVKLGWGTALVTENLDAKLERYRHHGIPVVLGGTLTELAISRGRLDELIAWVHELGLEHFEISDGTIALEHERKLEMIQRLAGEFIVLSEVGSKDDTGAITPPYVWVEQMRAGARRRRLEGDRRGARGRHRRHLPAQRRGPRGPDRRDRARDRSRPDHVRRAAQGSAGVVRPPVRARGQPRQHRPGRGAGARDAPARAALGHAGHRRPVRGRDRRSTGVLLARHGETNDNRSRSAFRASGTRR